MNTGDTLELSHWMRLQESINRVIAEELNALRTQIKELEDTISNHRTTEPTNMTQETDTPLNTAVRLFPLSLELAEEWKVRAEVEELQQQKRNCIEILDDDAIEIAELKAEVERLSKLTEDCLNVIRVYCPTYYNDAMERFNKTDK
jgi:DNA repair exonuclease SbcCD ATPase subunit